MTKLTLQPVLIAYKDACQNGGGHWTKADTQLAWSCLNSAGKFGSIDLPPGETPPPLLFIAVKNASESNKSLAYTVGAGSRFIEVDEREVPAP